MEHMKGGMYVKAIFKAIRHTVLPDPLYGKMIMKEFNNKLVEIRGQARNYARQKNCRRWMSWVY